MSDQRKINKVYAVGREGGLKSWEIVAELNDLIGTGCKSLDEFSDEELDKGYEHLQAVLGASTDVEDYESGI